MFKNTIAFLGMFLFFAMASQGVSYAYEYRLDDQYVSRKEYEKLQREMEELKAQMHLLLNNKKALRQQEPKRFALTPQAEIPPAKSAQGPIHSRAEAQPPAADTSRSEDSQGDRQKEAEEAKRQLDEFLRRQKVLFKPGDLQLEYDVVYAQDTARNACFGFDVRFCAPGSQITPKWITRTVDTGLVVRYGIIENLEFNVTMPFGFIEQEQDFTPFQVQDPIRRRNNEGLGDISWVLRYAAWREGGILPDVNLNLNAKSITGDEDQGLGSGFGMWGAG